jgi:hypothetical protein
MKFLFTIALWALSFNVYSKDSIDAMLIVAANKHEDVTPEFLAAVGHIETGFQNIKSKKSSAAGVYQFTKTTWKQQLRDAPRSLGVSRKASVYDVKASTEIAAFFTQQNADNLRAKLRRNPTPGELYITHLLGPGGGLLMIKAPKWKRAADVVPDAVPGNKALFVNKNGDWLTVGQFRKNLSVRVNYLIKKYEPRIDRMEKELTERALDRAKPWRHWLKYDEPDYMEVSIEPHQYRVGTCSEMHRTPGYVNYCNHWPINFEAYALRRRHAMTKI